MAFGSSATVVPGVGAVTCNSQELPEERNATVSPAEMVSTGSPVPVRMVVGPVNWIEVDAAVARWTEIVGIEIVEMVVPTK